MPPIDNPNHHAIAWPARVEPAVQKPATRVPHLGAKLFSYPLSAWFLCVFLWAAVLGLFRVTTVNEYEKRPIGDAAYFCEMTQAFYLGEPPTINFSTMHSRRILGPWLAAQLCSALDFVGGKKATATFHYGYHADDYFRNWSPEAGFTYARITEAWKILNAAAFLGIFLSLFGILQHFQPERAPQWQWQPIWVAFILCCSPTLGRLYFFWPLMNDLVGISLGLLSLLCLLKNRVLLSGLLFGSATLARENLAFIYPCFLWTLFTCSKESSSRRLLKPSLIHVLLSVLPYCLIYALPVFPNVAPFSDWSSGIQEKAVGATSDYWSLVLYHLHRAFAADHALLRQCLVYWSVLGPLLFLALRFYPWKRTQLRRDALLWGAVVLVMMTSFYVDRYVVYAVFPLVLLARHVVSNGIPWWLAGSLSCFYLAAVQFFNERARSTPLQMEFTDRSTLMSVLFWGVCGILILALMPIVQLRVGAAPQKTAGEQGVLA